MKIVFAGTPEFSLPCLQALIESKHDVCAVYTQPDRPAGRGRKLTASPIKQLALEHEIPIYQPPSLKKEEAQQELQALQPDVMVVIAYGLILPKAVLELPKFGCVNVHASLLPKWRGASPIQQVLLHGEQKTGVTIMQMDEHLDTGDMLNVAECDIGKNENAKQLHDKLAMLGVEPLLQTLNEIEQGTTTPVVQDDDKATIVGKISKQQGEINWSDSAKDIHNKIRAFNPWPIAFTKLDGALLRIHQAQVIDANETLKPGQIIHASKRGIEVACGSGAVLLEKLQLPGAKVVQAHDLLNSKRDLFCPGKVLGSSICHE